MKIYSVLITSDYDMESVILFTSLRKCYNFICGHLEEIHNKIHDLEFIDYEELELNYKNMKNKLNSEEYNNYFEIQIYTDYRTTIEVNRHDTEMSKFTQSGRF
jgi:hypothetical protein